MLLRISGKDATTARRTIKEMDLNTTEMYSYLYRRNNVRGFYLGF